MTYNATGSYSYENSWSVTGSATGETYSGELVKIGSCVTACTDELADNYNSAADISDNSLCEYAVVPGCMTLQHVIITLMLVKTMVLVNMLCEGFDCDGNCLEGTLTSYFSYGDIILGF